MSLIVENHEYQQISEFLSEKIIAYNHAHWNLTTKLPLAISHKDNNGQIDAGISGVAFGNWLSIERLWVSETLRGQGVGAQLLAALENEAKANGCKFALVDTLEFQAKPFYERYGYEVQWQQDYYPLDGIRYYLKKAL